MVYSNFEPAFVVPEQVVCHGVACGAFAAGAVGDTVAGFAVVAYVLPQGGVTLGTLELLGGGAVFLGG